MSDLSNDTLLYRAISKESWLDARTGEIQPEAFQLGFNQKIEEWEQGLSTDLEPEFSYRHRYTNETGEYELKFSKCYGILALAVGDIRDLGLDVDNDHDTHVNIIGFPEPEKQPKKYDAIVADLIEKAKVYLIFDPPKKKSKKKK